MTTDAEQVETAAEQVESTAEQVETTAAPTPRESESQDSQNQPEQPPVRDDCKTIDHILNMRVPLIVKIAQRRMTVQEILKFNLGSMIQFDKDAYDHVDLMVNNTTIGLGQPVKVGENFGLRIVQIGDIKETIKSLARDAKTST